MYKLIELTNYNDGTKPSQGIYTYDTQEEAVANFHTKLGGAMKNAIYESEMLLVIDITGAVIEHKYWVRAHEIIAEEIEE